MAYYTWRERPLETPMARVVERTFEDGKVRYVVQFYEGVTYADFRETEKWVDGKSYKRQAAAERKAMENDRWMRQQAYRDKPPLYSDRTPPETP